MILAGDDCMHALRRLRPIDGEAGGAGEGGGLQTIHVTEGDGQFRLRVSISSEEEPISVDLAPGALRLSNGLVSRWVPLPADAIPDRAVVQRAAGALTVCMPVKERRPRRNRAYVW